MPTNLKHTDPTYLRTIHDGLLSGAMHKDNASALPIGLVGMYEEALPPAGNVKERKKFLEFFFVWALLKKEVSANFVLQFLFWWNEEEILEYISKYANWFNSPSNGKYILYHQRLRSFFLARMSNIDSKNTDLLEGLLELDGLSGDDEFKNYLEEFYGDHLIISLQFNGSEENYNKLKTIDEIIEQRQWRVNNLNRLRWNEMSVSIASYELDVPFLRKLYIVQDQIVSKKANLSLICNQVFKGHFLELDERLLFAENEVEKCYFLFFVLSEIIEKISAIGVGDSHHISVLSHLVDRLNKLHCKDIWLIPIEVLLYWNDCILKFTLNQNNNPIQLELLNFYDKDWDDLPEWIFTTPEYLKVDLVITLNECLEIKDLEIDKLEFLIKDELVAFVKNEITPEYRGDLKKLDSVFRSIDKYCLFKDSSGLNILELIKLVGVHVGYTGNSDLNLNFDDLIRKLLFKIILKFPSFSETNWIEAFLDSFIWVDTIVYYKTLSCLLHNKAIKIADILSHVWRSRENYRIVGLASSTILSKNNTLESSIQFYKDLLKGYLEYDASLVSENWLESIRCNDREFSSERNELNQSNYELILKQYSNYEFRHIPTLSNILCEKYDLLELISFLRDNITYYSDVAKNKELITDLLKGLIVALGFAGTKEYIIAGLEKYVPIMGSYGAYDYEFEYNRPSENVWAIEWWVIGDVVYEFTQIAESMETELYLDYSNNFGDNEYEYLLNEGVFYQEIESVFASNNCSPEDNLYRVIDDFKYIRPQRNYRNCLSNILFDYKVNPTKTLLRFKEISSDRQLLNCLVRAISRE